MWLATPKVLLYATLLLVCMSITWAAAGNATVTVMTQNMDAGTDLGFALAYLNTSTPTVGIDLTYQEILQSNFAGRAALLAQEIAAVKPHLVSLQEATLWSTGPGPSQQAPLFDQLQLLLNALGALGEDYAVVEVNQLTTTALPMSSGVWLGYMDRDVVLARNGTGLGITNVRKNIFAAKLSIPSPLGPIDVPQGWIAADVTLGGHTFTFVDTHLQSTFPGQPEIALLQVAQAQELAGAFIGTYPVVIAGDFNSNATHTPPERTQSVGVMTSAGYTDAWPVVNHGNPGFTWPLYFEDPLAAHPKGPFERIDFIFERGFGIQSVDRIGWKAPHASDHAGVAASLAF
ncbi:MAG TPA: endonuclease/exonuclease/phosphatase family protein [Bryobacteraceae bacterium]|nr:endonuclease/exonuclease/phosphatase family protein [Bryobacteraceae bacterium]